MDDLISRQAAIAFVDCGYLRPPTELAWSDKDVVDMLKRLPSAQPQDIARDIATIIENEKDMRVVLKNAEPQRIKGRWELLPGRDDEHIRYLHCSVCHFNGDYESNFCPNCGADMRGEQDG